MCCLDEKMLVHQDKTPSESLPSSPTNMCLTVLGRQFTVSSCFYCQTKPIVKRNFFPKINLLKRPYVRTFYITSILFTLLRFITYTYFKCYWSISASHHRGLQEASKQLVFPSTEVSLSKENVTFTQGAFHLSELASQTRQFTKRMRKFEDLVICKSFRIAGTIFGMFKYEIFRTTMC